MSAQNVSAVKRSLLEMNEAGRALFALAFAEKILNRYYFNRGYDAQSTIEEILSALWDSLLTGRLSADKLEGMMEFCSSQIPDDDNSDLLSSSALSVLCLAIDTFYNNDISSVNDILYTALDSAEFEDADGISGNSFSDFDEFSISMAEFIQSRDSLSREEVEQLRSLCR